MTTTTTTATATATAPRHEFRAATIEEAVALATRELGPRIRIIEANRIRRGGVGGFFATDLGVEVIVESDDEAATDELPDRSSTSDDLLDEMRRLGIDVDELEPGSSATRATPAPSSTTTSSTSSTPAAARRLDAIIDDVQSDERSFAVQSLGERAGSAPSPSFMDTLEHELRADRDRPAEIAELPRRPRHDGASDPGDRATSNLRPGAPSLAVSSELTGSITEIDGPVRRAAQGREAQRSSISRLATRLETETQPADRAPAAITGRTNGAEQPGSTAANMAAHIEAIADLPRARRESAAIASAVTDPAVIRPGVSMRPAPLGVRDAARVNPIGAADSSTTTGRELDAADPITIGREMAAEAARSVMTQLAQLDADHLRPMDLRGITVSVTTPTGNTIAISAELGEVTP